MICLTVFTFEGVRNALWRLRGSCQCADSAHTLAEAVARAAKIVLSLVAFVLVLFLWDASAARAAHIVLPEQQLAVLLEIPYRVDGALNDSGAYATFAAPGKTFTTPGLNCSGFVLEAARLLRGTGISLAEAKRDRLHDSGPNAPYGQDWDFGLDLVLNITEGTARRWLMPGGKTLGVQDMPLAQDMARLRGFDLHDPATWAELSTRLKPDAIYFLSFNKATAKPGYRLLHYHVALLWRTPDGKLWIYQTTPERGKSYRQEISSAAGRAAFLKAFANTGGVRKMLLVLEMDMESLSGAE